MTEMINVLRGENNEEMFSFFFFFFLVILEIDLRAPHLLGRHSTT
jgi:hypothetical protein